MRNALAGVAAVAAAALAGCGGGKPQDARVVRVVEQDFTIRAPRTIAPGRVRLLVRNRGPVEHELLLVRATRAGLPLRADGFTLDEDALERRLVATVEPQPPGTETSLDVSLERGTYVLVCNMSGHAAAGMQRTITVR
jgi:uncharacterized cupredoxin-like copper-binding protein